MHKFLLIVSGIYLMGCSGDATSTKTGDVSAAEKEMRAYIKQHPDSLLLKENLIQYFRDNSNYGEALAVTETALQKDSLNDRLWDIKATLHFENADTPHAIQSFERAIAINPIPAYILSLASLYAQTKNPMAIAMANALLQVPNANADKEAFFIKGLYYSYSGEKMKAIAFFDECLALDYRNVLAYREKAICLYDLAKYNEAMALLEKAVAVQNSFDEGYYWMGRCYEKLNKNTQAIASYQQALQIDPAYIEAKDALSRLGVKS